VNEIDREVAEKVMEWKRMTNREIEPDIWEPGEEFADKFDLHWREKNGESTYRCAEDGDIYEHEYAWSPSTDISAAFEVVEKVKTMLFSKRLMFRRALREIISKRLGLEDGYFIDDSEIILNVTPEDICLAALAALEGKK
jgi:hypothetical protein